MVRGKLLLLVLMAAAMCTVSMADTKTPQSNLSAEEIVKKNVSARGGLQAWKAVTALTLGGKMEAGGNQRPTLPVPGPKHGAQMPRPRPTEQVQLPFVMELKRPRKERMEIQFNGQTAVQVYDGANGWKLRPFLNRHEVEPYTAEELKAAAAQAELDGPLVDYAAKGTKIEFSGTEKVEGRNTYKLQLTPKSGEPFHIWIDAETFLEAKMEGTPRRLDGKNHPVEVYFRDYRTVNGLVVPYLLETKVLAIKGVPGVQETSEKIRIEEVTVNPKLADTLFSKPQVDAGVNAKQTAPAGGHSLP